MCWGVGGGVGKCRGRFGGVGKRVGMWGEMSGSVRGGVEAVEKFCERCWGFPCLPHTSPHLFSPLPHPNTSPTS